MNILFSGWGCCFLTERVLRCMVMVDGRRTKQRHRTSLLERQSMVTLLGFSCTQQVHPGKATSTAAKNPLFLSALVGIFYIIALQFVISSM